MSERRANQAVQGSTVPWRDLLAGAASTLRAAGLANAAVDARRIVEEASGHEGAELQLRLADPATERGVADLDSMVARRLSGEPLQYVLGRWGFRTLDLMVDRRVLIPRPETEEVAGHALDALDRAVGGGASPVAVDMGSGSGAIGLSVAAERPGTDVWCVDASPGAVAVTRANLAGLGIAGGRVSVVEGSWFGPLPDEIRGQVGLIVSNPPYVSEADPLPPEVAAWEPLYALVPGPTGLEAVERIVAEAPDWLAPTGELVVEIGATQGPVALDLARRAGFTDVELRADLSGRDRALLARRWLARRWLARKSVARGSVARGSVARGSVARGSVASVASVSDP